MFTSTLLRQSARCATAHRALPRVAPAAAFGASTPNVGAAVRWINTGDSVLAGGGGGDLTVKVVRNGEVQDVTLADLFKGKKIALFGVPGAFTPLCTGNHLPGYVQHADSLRSKGVDEVVCLTVNDPAVSTAWANHVNAGDKVSVAADWNAALTKKLEQEIDLSAAGLGERSKRSVTQTSVDLQWICIGLVLVLTGLRRLSKTER
eukprot:gb/GECG01008721.1/.p1 GENE.gb/GECG01008721.1/~~gb/GECG01008721.1/.p1  ORF type:complete len:205 (+),score=23.36 gb/GECG01008721.1/:1-615(+)